MTKHRILAEHENDNRVHRLETTDEGFCVRHLRRQDPPNGGVLVEVKRWNRPVNEDTEPAYRGALLQAIRVFSHEAGVAMLETENAVAASMGAAYPAAPQDDSITKQTEIAIATVGDLRKLLERMPDSDPIAYMDFHGGERVAVQPHDPNNERRAPGVAIWS